MGLHAGKQDSLFFQIDAVFSYVSAKSVHIAVLFFCLIVVCRWLLSLSEICFFVSTDVKLKQKDDSKGCNAFWVCSTLYLQPRGVFTGLPK